MRIKFVDNYGTKETLYYNPGVVLYGDGSVIALATTVWLYGKKSEIPMYAGMIDELWCDPKRKAYDNNPMNNEPGAFRVAWKEGNTVYISRYKERLAESLFSRIKRKLNI